MQTRGSTRRISRWLIADERRPRKPRSDPSTALSVRFLRCIEPGTDIADAGSRNVAGVDRLVRRWMLPPARPRLRLRSAVLSLQSVMSGVDLHVRCAETGHVAGPDMQRAGPRHAVGSRAGTTPAPRDCAARHPQILRAVARLLLPSTLPVPCPVLTVLVNHTGAAFCA
eukprot:2558650-Rhodomonas_salina.7